jgi:hypothetical protein
MGKIFRKLKVILSRLAFLVDCPFSSPMKMFLPTSALVHFMQQAREIHFSTFYAAGTGNQNEAAESLPGVIGSLKF